MMEPDANLCWIWEPRYDTCFLYGSGAGVGQINLFQVPIGQIGTGSPYAKSNAETNLSAAGQLCRPNQFLLYGFAASVPESTSKEDKDAIRKGVFRFILGSNHIKFELPMSLIPINPSEKNEFFDSEGKIKDKRIEEIPYKTGFYYLCPQLENQKELLPWLIDGDQCFRVEIFYPSHIVMPSGKDCRLTVFMIGLYGKA